MVLALTWRRGRSRVVAMVLAFTRSSGLNGRGGRSGIGGAGGARVGSAGGARVGSAGGARVGSGGVGRRVGCTSGFSGASGPARGVRGRPGLRGRVRGRV
jgi:hypothetical protein